MLPTRNASWVCLMRKWIGIPTSSATLQWSDQHVLREGTVLAVAGGETVVVLTEDVFELRLCRADRYVDSDDDVAAPDAFFQWRIVAHLVLLGFNRFVAPRCPWDTSPTSGGNLGGVSEG